MAPPTPHMSDVRITPLMQSVRISGDPTPSPDDARLTLRLCAAADVLDLPLLDHLIVGDEHRYFSFREAGLMGATPARR